MPCSQDLVRADFRAERASSFLITFECLEKTEGVLAGIFEDNVNKGDYPRMKSTNLKTVVCCPYSAQA